MITRAAPAIKPRARISSFLRSIVSRRRCGDCIRLRPDPGKAQRVTEAMLKVRGKFEIDDLRAAYDAA